MMHMRDPDFDREMFMITLTPEQQKFYDSLVLSRGDHSVDSGEFCLLEAESYLLGEPFGTHVDSVCRMIREWGVLVNDTVSDEARQRLKPLLLRMPGTANDGHADARGWLCVDWAVRTCLAAHMRLQGKIDLAEELSSLREITDVRTMALALPALARDLALDRDLARALAYTIARDLARDHAFARDHALFLARDLAVDLARALDAGRDAGLFRDFQESKIALLECMVALGEETRRAA